MKTQLITQRKSKVVLEDFAPYPSPIPLSFLDILPNILAAKDLKSLVHDIDQAYRNNKPVILTFGAHVIKCGLSKVVCGLIKDELIDCIATNGASAIHDVEIALHGRTSEDVGEGLLNGSFGTTVETLDFINNSINNLVPIGYGYGTSIGRSLNQMPFDSKMCSSIFRNAYRYGCDPFVHVAIGTDITHMHPSANGSLIGQSSLADFHAFVDWVGQLGGGGVLLNFGSAVILPEVILKAVAIGRAKGVNFGGCVMADFDMIKQYRSTTRIVETAKLLGGTGYSFTGHHELILPVLGGLMLGLKE